MIDDDNFLDESQHISHGRHLTTVQSSTFQYFSSVGQIDQLTKVLKDPSSEAVKKVSSDTLGLLVHMFCPKTKYKCVYKTILNEDNS